MGYARPRKYLSCEVIKVWGKSVRPDWLKKNFALLNYKDMSLEIENNGKSSTFSATPPECHLITAASLFKMCKSMDLEKEGQFFAITMLGQINNLKFLIEQKIHTIIQQKRVAKLLGLDYEIQYKKGVYNRVADALSRRGESDQDMAMTTVKPNWNMQVIESYKGDPLFSKVIAVKVVDESTHPEYTLNQRVLRYMELCVGNSTNLRQRILETMPSSSYRGILALWGLI